MLRIDLDDNNIIDMKYLYYMMNINFYVKSMGSSTGVLLNILLGALNHDSQNSPNETHELGS